MVETYKRKLLISILLIFILFYCFHIMIYFANAEENNENISTIATETFPEVYYLNNTQKITIDEYKTMEQEAENKLNQALGNDGNGNITVNNWKRTQGKIIGAIEGTNMNWLWNLVTQNQNSTEYWFSDSWDIWDASRLQKNNDDYMVNRYYSRYILENKITAMYDTSLQKGTLYDAATWMLPENLATNQYSIERFQGEFEVKNNPRTHDYTLSTVVNDDIFYINDDMYVFVYPKDTTITNDNFLEYFAFWGGTANLKENQTFHSIAPLSKIIKNKDYNNFILLTDQYYMNVVNDNIGDFIDDTWVEGKENKYILDIFILDYNGGGGMYRPIITSTENNSTSTTISLRVKSTTGKLIENSTFRTTERIWDEEGTSGKDGILNIKLHPSDTDTNLHLLEHVSTPGYQSINTTWNLKVNTDGSYLIGGTTYNSSSADMLEVILAPIDYTITLDTAGGQLPTGIDSTMPYTIEDTITLPTSLTRKDYVFAGWKITSADGNWNPQTLYTGELDNMYGNITLTAEWKKVGTVKEGIVKNGKHFDSLNVTTNTVTIYNDYCATAEFIVENCIPNSFFNRKISFTQNLPSGTKIIMLDKTVSNNIMYYYYKVDSATNLINLTDFKQMGSDSNYIESTNDSETDEKLQFIIDFSESEELAIENTMILTREVLNTTFSEQKISYNSANSPIINFNLVNTPTSIKNNIELSYSNNVNSFDNSKLKDRKTTIVITNPENNFPDDLTIYDGINYYIANSEGKIIIPLGNVEENKDITLKVISKYLHKNEMNCNLNIELWATENENNPFMGYKIKTIENVNLKAVDLPDIKLEMTNRLYLLSEITDNFVLEYVSNNITNYKTTLELQKKNNDETYTLQNEMILSVNENEINENGVFEITLEESDQIDLRLNNDANLEIGTYRILIKIYESDTNIIEVPYNFIIKE